MATPMYFSFLRPLALPRSATLQRFLATATTTVPASPIKSPTTSPSSSTESIRISGSSNLPYRVDRTPSNSLPIYLLRKRGGNLHQTKLRKIEGNVNVLRRDLLQALKLEEKDIVINQLTKQIIIKGHRKPEVAQFLVERHF